MADLFRLPATGLLEPMEPDPFKDETVDLEGFIKRNPTVLGNGVRVFAEQVDTGFGDRIDLLALDESSTSGELLLIELKNVSADEKVLLQALRYASWMVGNPDSVRLLLERQSIDASTIDIRPIIIIVAPEIESGLIEMSQYVSDFQFSFVEISRFKNGGDRFVLINWRTPVGKAPPGVQARDDWDWEKYQRDLKISAERIDTGKMFASQLLDLADEHGWQVEMRFRKWYVPFQLPGPWNVFELGLSGATGSGTGWNIAIKLPGPPEASDLPSWVVSPKWEASYNNVRITLPERGLNLRDLEPLLEAAYEYVRKKAGV
jgi:hypothetical protein